ncbi:MAG TPA: hypothetical protein VM537_19100 [Anaerolineae bacterium]|nr:hypothetical protein [Anaerolineae bacterium]
METAVKHTERLEWRKLVVPTALRKAPIHRWFVFPHSYTDSLVRNLIEEWELGPGDRILDPFVGAGTTVLTAKQMGIPAHGVDLSPLAVFVTNAKVADHDPDAVRQGLAGVLKDAGEVDSGGETELLHRAFTPLALQRLCGLRQRTRQVTDPQVRGFLLLGLLAILRDFSSLKADGGWLRAGRPRLSGDQVMPRFRRQMEMMLSDLPEQAAGATGSWSAEVGDARALPGDTKYSAVITSPPYPNRHDYSRIFQVELEFGFYRGPQTYDLRHRSMRSHPEARPPSVEPSGYTPPARLQALLDELREKKPDARIPAMLAGYFEDMHAVLWRLSGALCPGARLALVVGNVRYLGVGFPVDELLTDIAAGLGYQPVEIRAVRYRGNSAQQMGEYGREGARESCVMLRAT